MNTTASISISDANNRIIAKNKLKPASRKKKKIEMLYKLGCVNIVL